MNTSAHRKVALVDRALLARWQFSCGSAATLEIPSAVLGASFAGMMSELRCPGVLHSARSARSTFIAHGGVTASAVRIDSGKIYM